MLTLEEFNKSILYAEETSAYLDFKLNYQETTGCYPDPEKERSRLKLLATTEHLKNASILTQILNISGIKKLFWHNRILCRALTGNANLGYLLRIIVCRWLTNERDECFLKYRDDIGYSFWHTAKDFAAETGISVHTIYKLIPKLRDEGWIEIYYKQDVFGRVKWHIKLQVETFIKRLITYAQSQLVSFTNCNLQNIPIVSYINQIIKNNMEQKNSSTPKGEVETAENTYINSEKITQSPGDYNNCPKKTNAVQVEEKINIRKSDRCLGQRSQARATRAGSDRYFGQPKNQQQQIRRRAKMDSAVGMSGFKDLEQLEDFCDRLIEYYLEIYDYETASKKVKEEIKAAKEGQRSQLVKEFLNDEPLGSRYKQEWEIKRGVLLPAFEAYLAHQLRKDGDTPEQVQVKVFWHKKDTPKLKAAWAECKRVINIQKPKLKQAIQLGRDLTALDIPQWFITAFREEVSVEEVAGTAEVLGAIATRQTQQVKQHFSSLASAEIPELPDGHPIKDLLSERKCFTSSNGALPSADETSAGSPRKLEEKNADVDRVVGVVRDNDPESVEQPTATTADINRLLGDSITRDRGIFMAKQQDLPLLLNDEGIAIAIDDREQAYEPGHEIYVPPKIEKGSKTAWEEAVSKSRFLRKVRGL